jgi:hypothetical protein
MKLIPLLEITFSDAPQVDRDAGVIRSVRILGRTSRNGREYSDTALKQAARFYDRLGVNLNHPERQKTDGARAVEDGFGWLESIDVRADGVYGDLHYFRAHPCADVIVEAAVRNPRRFGLSHHAEGRVMQHQGKLVVESIESVRSVDVVQNPATNLGLFESETLTVPRTIREILQETDDPLAQLVEEISFQSAADHAIDVPDEAPHKEQVAIALQSLLVKVLEDEQFDVPTRLQQVFRLMDAHQSTASNDFSDANAPAVVTQLLERIERIEVEAHCRALLESTNRSCEPARLQALAALATDDERHQLIESWPERDAGRVFRPRPNTSRPLYETQTEGVMLPRDVKSFVAAIR